MNEKGKAMAYDKVRKKIALIFGSNVAEEIFPEFEESEDERIRNCIGMCLTDANEQRFKDYNTSLKECIAWIEKQGENTLIEEIKRRKELYSREKEKAVLFAEKLSLGGRIAVLEELLVFANEKQGEQKPILDFKASNWYVSKVDGKIHDLTYNPTDKTEPTFKVGDWIVTDKNNITQIKAVNNGYYTIDNGMDFNMSYVDKYWRLWTIQDAKDGDVLWHSDSASNGIFIFKEIRYDGKVLCYCDYDSEDYFCLGEHHTCCWANAKILHPATKEQRDLLFQKMKEAGLEWDADKKKLKKLTQSVTKTSDKGWSEEDERIYQSIIDDTVQENQLDSKQIDWLKNIKYRNFARPKQD